MGTFFDIVGVLIFAAVSWGIVIFFAKGFFKGDGKAADARIKEWQDIYRHQISADRIKSEWSDKIIGGKGKGEQFLKNVIARVEKTKFSGGVTWSRETMYYGDEKKQPQEFIVFVNGLREVRGWKMLVGAEDWGKLLDVVCYLYLDITDSPTEAMPQGTTPWEEREIQNFGGQIAAIVEEEAKRVRDGLPLSFDKDGTGSGGFLNIT